MDEMTQLLLSRLAAGPGASPELSLPDVLERSLGDDPLAAPLASALRQREAAVAASAEEAEPGEDLEPEVADVLERLYAELEGLRERNELFAAALGACPRCFGDDELCPVCNGRGRPGGREPDRTLFAELVRPALRRAGEPAVFAAQVMEKT
jgi:hypothetical protein